MTDPADTIPARIISYAWGESYLEDLLSFAVPALLAPGNLPYFASQVKCELIIVTEERFFAKIVADRAIATVQELCPIRLVSLDDLITRSDQYGMALTHALHRAFADLGPAMTDYWLVFFNADFILADGSLRNLLGHFRRGERIIASPSYCTIKDAAVVELKKRTAADPTVLALPPREMAHLILKNRHDTIRGKTINESGLYMYYMDQFYWLADDNTLLGSQMPVAIVGMRPERYVVEPNTNWDHGLILEYCPESEAKLLGDSDEFLMLELRDRGVAQNELVSGTPDIRALGERMIKWVTSYQAAFAKRPLILHAGDPSPSIDQARRQLDDFIDRILSYVPKFPSYVDHPQWNYHWPDFMKTRHGFLSNKYRSMTADFPPPQWMYPIDRLWWRLNGIETAHARKIGLITDAIKEIDRELEVYPRLIVEKVAAINPQADQTILSGAPSLTLGREPDTCAGSGQVSGEISSTLQTVENAFVRKLRDANGKKAILRDAIAAAEGEFLAHEGAAYEKLKCEYETLLRPRVKTAGIPIVERRVGKDAAAGQVERNLQQLLRSTFHALFGRWPRVTMLSPYWAALQPLQRAINRAKADGARDVLLVGSEPSVREAIHDFAEAYS